MAILKAHSIVLGLPEGWDGSIYRRPDAGGAQSYPVVHAANFALPPVRGDYGGGAVELMGPKSVFLSLFEFAPESVSRPLFAFRGVPAPVDPERFSPGALQRLIKGQAGYQRFFQESGRAFALYVVLGSYVNRSPLTESVNTVLSDLEIGRIPS